MTANDFITNNYFLVPCLFSFVILKNSVLQRLFLYIIKDSRIHRSFEKEVILSSMKTEILEDLITFDIWEREKKTLFWV